MTAPLPAALAWKVGGISVDSDVGARELYAIRRADGRICFGGARALEPDAAIGSSDDATTSTVVGDYLRRFLREHFPELGGGAAGGEVEVEAEWTGVLGFTTDGKPIVGPLARRPAVYVAAGFCGHGMPQCYGVGKSIALMLGGRADEVHEHIRDEAAPARWGY